MLTKPNLSEADDTQGNHQTSLVSEGHLDINTPLLIFQSCEDVCSGYNANQLGTAVHHRNAMYLHTGKIETCLPLTKLYSETA